MSNTSGSRTVRRVVVSLVQSVRECTEHELDVPDHVGDGEILAWVNARARATALPPAVREVPPRILNGDQPHAEVVSLDRFDPAELPPAPLAYHVAAGEPNAVLALRFNTDDGRSLTLTGLSGAQLTYERIRTGEHGEQIAAFAADGTIATLDRADPFGVSWLARFARAATALDGSFKEIELLPNVKDMYFALSADDEENPDLTLGEPRSRQLGSHALINGYGLTNARGFLKVTREQDTSYWASTGKPGRFSDLTIFRR
jgi:hypothetical protein